MAKIKLKFALRREVLVEFAKRDLNLKSDLNPASHCSYLSELHQLLRVWANHFWKGVKPKLRRFRWEKNGGTASATSGDAIRQGKKEMLKQVHLRKLLCDIPEEAAMLIPLLNRRQARSSAYKIVTVAVFPRLNVLHSPVLPPSPSRLQTAMHIGDSKREVATPSISKAYYTSNVGWSEQRSP